MEKKSLHLFLLLLFTAFSCNLMKAADYYWRGGSGSWSDINHWFDGGGFPRVTPPDASDDVYFDVNSGFTAFSNLLTIASDARCRNIKFENCPVAPKIRFMANLNVSGSFQLQADMEILGHLYTNYAIYFLSSSAGNEIISNGVPLYIKFQFDGSGEWIVKDPLTIESQDLESTYQRGITVNNGKLILDNTQYTGFYLKTNNSASISLQNAVVNTVCWEYNSAMPLTVAATGGSTINLAYDTNYWEVSAPAWLKTNAAGDQYNDVIITGGCMPYSIQGGVFNKLSFKGANGSISTATQPVTAKELELYAPGKYELAGAVTINEKFSILPFGETGCGGFIELCSTYPGAQRLITYNGAPSNLTAERVLIQDMIITGSHAATGLDGGNNIGWTITPLTGTICNWIGGTGNWNDPVHWSGSCIPTPFDEVVFDNSSGFTASGQEVLINMTAYAKNLSFNGTGNPPAVVLNFPVEIHGSLKFQSGMYARRRLDTYTTITAAFIFRSNDAETITMNGVQPRELPLYFNSRSETGSWTLQDELAFSSGNIDILARFNGIYHQSGHLNFNGQNVSAFRFNSVADDAFYKSSRSIDIANSTIRITTLARAFYEGGWVHLGGQPLIAAQSAGSRLIINNMSYTFYVGKTGDVYDELECYGSGIGTENIFGGISDGKFQKVTLSAGNARVYSFETEELVFASSGNYLLCSPADIKINQRLASEMSCGGAIIFTSDIKGTQRSFAMGSGAAVNLRNASLTDVRITGDGVPYPVTESVDGGNNTGWDFQTGTPTDFYWIGGTGVWSDPAHWSTVSGDPSYAGTCVPGLTDNVFFDNNSFSAPGQTVRLDVSAYCNNMSWIGNESLKPVFNTDEHGVFINGSLELQKGMIFDYIGTMQENLSKSLTFTSNTSVSIKSNGVIVPMHIIFNGVGSWIFEDEFKQGRGVATDTGYTSLQFIFTNGRLDFNGQKVTINAFVSQGGNNTRILNIADSEIIVTAYHVHPWRYTGGAALTINDTKNSTIRLQAVGASYSEGIYFEAKPGDVYYNLESENQFAEIMNATFNKVHLKAHTTINNIIADTLQFKPNNNIYKFTSGATTKINKVWYGSGNNCYYNTIQSTVPGTQATVDVNIAAANYTEINPVDGSVIRDDILYMDYIQIRDINVVTSNGIVPVVPRKGPRSPNDPPYGSSGNNSSNWIMDTYFDKDDPGFRALGPNVSIMCDNFPYTIYTTGMVPTNESTFRWYKGDPKSGGEYLGDDGEMLITSTADIGTYYCIVDYTGDGSCELEANITINAPYAALLVWTGAFNQDWNNYRNWDNPDSDNSVDQAVPARCIDVLIPDLLSLNNYPDLTQATINPGNPEIACAKITFEHGGEVLRTDLLDFYTFAEVHMTLESNRWYMLSVPLHNIYSGDIYVNNSNPYQDGYFIYPMLFNQVNPQTGIKTPGYTWSQSFNTPDVEFRTGEGFALWVDEVGTEYTDNNPTNFVFPKNDERYYYYAQHNEEVFDSTNVINRSKHGRFIYEGIIDASGDVPLAASPCDVAGEYIMVGNPFMAHLDFDQFATANSAYIETEYKMASGINVGEDGKVNGFVSYIKDGSGNYVSNDGNNITRNLIPPMQSFLVKSKVASTPLLKANVSHTVVEKGSRLRSKKSKPGRYSQITVSAVRGSQTSKVTILQRDNASNDYVSSEDSYKLFSQSAFKPVELYTRSADGYALDINYVSSLDEGIVLGIYTSVKGDITLQFEGIENLNKEVYLHDNYLDIHIPLSSQTEYTFNKTNDELYEEDRFILTFSDQSTDVNSLQSKNVFLDNPAHLQLQLVTSEKLENVSVFNLQGQCMTKETDLNIGTHYIELPVRGVYIVQLKGRNMNETRKIVIK